MKSIDLISERMLCDYREGICRRFNRIDPKLLDQVLYNSTHKHQV